MGGVEGRCIGGELNRWCKLCGRDVEDDSRKRFSRGVGCKSIVGQASIFHQPHRRPEDGSAHPIMNELKIPAKLVRNDENARACTVWNQRRSQPLILSTLLPASSIAYQLTKYFVNQVLMNPL